MRPQKPLLVALGLAGVAAWFAQRASAAVAVVSPAKAVPNAYGVPAYTTQAARPVELSPRGRAFIKQEEGFEPKAYKDGVVGGIQMYSIGYGHQIVPGDGLNKNSVITAEHAGRLFDADVASREKAVRLNVTAPLSQAQFDALVSLAYNIGIGAFKTSTLLKRLNEGNYTEALARFHEWNKSGGKVHPVLVGRRQREANMFAEGWGARV